MTYNTTGIILKYRDIGEYDRIYTVLTSEHGKIEAWAQGVRKPKSKLVAHLQPLYLCDFMFARGRRFDRVAQVQVLNRFPELWADLEKLSQAVYAGSLIDLVLRPGTKEHNVFDLMVSVLDFFNSHPERSEPQASEVEGSPANAGSRTFVRDSSGTSFPQNDNLVTLFSLHLLKESGFSPELHHCVFCKKVVEGLSRRFDAARGGVLCGACVLSPPPPTPPNPPSGRGENPRAGGEKSPLLYKEGMGVVFPVSSLTLETLETVLVSPLSRLEMPETVRRELSTIADAMVTAHFGEEPRARRFMESIMMPRLPQMAGV